MDRAHRRGLKHDKFVEQVGHSVEYAAEHRAQLLKWGGLALAVIIAIAAWSFYSKNQHAARQKALREAMNIQQAQIGPGGNEFIVTFSTQAEKDQAVQKAFNDIIDKYGGSDEAAMAHYFLGITAADRGDLQEAEKRLKIAADTADKEYASQANLTLAQLYASTGREGEAEKLLRSLVDNPTVFVSKDQATVELGRVLAKTNPAEARKLLEPLRTERGPVSRAALTTLGEIK